MGKEAIYDERVKAILVGMNEGKSREELAKEFGHSDYRSLDIYMRRRHFRWNPDKQRYEPMATVLGEDWLESGAKGKVKEILSQLDSGLDPRTVAQNTGFRDHRALAEYMKKRGYVWEPDRKTYTPQRGAVPVDHDENKKPEDASIKRLSPSDRLTFEDCEPLLKMLLANQDKLRELLKVDPSETALPRYLIPGRRITKSVVTVVPLDDLVKAYSKQYNVSQKEIYEIAAIVFLK